MKTSVHNKSIKLKLNTGKLLYAFAAHNNLGGHELACSKWRHFFVYQSIILGTVWLTTGSAFYCFETSTLMQKRYGWAAGQICDDWHLACQIYVPSRWPLTKIFRMSTCRVTCTAFVPDSEVNEP